MEINDISDETRLPDTESTPVYRPYANEKWIIKGYVRERAGSVFEVRRTKLRDHDELMTITAGRCAGCDEIFRSSASIGGACSECGLILCSRCSAERRCRICGKLTCSSHGMMRTLDGVPAYRCFGH